MSWLISLLIAGAMFTSDGSQPIKLNYDNGDDNIKKIVRLDEVERFEQTYPLNAAGRVSVSNVNGSITIDTWDNPQVKLEYVKTADSRERLSEVGVRIDARQDSIRIETDYGDWKQTGNKEWKMNGKLVVEYRLTVPRTAILDEIATVNGRISISNAANITKASAVNGEVRATNLRGTANLSTVNGIVQADFDQMQAGSRISLNTVNGRVDLTIPSDSNATLKADTLNGSITNDFGLPVRKGQYVGKDMYGRIGSGNVQIQLNSVNGGLSVRRKNDGGNLNPATNLLPPKSKMDDDFNKQIDEDVDEDNKDIKEEKKLKAKEAKIRHKVYVKRIIVSKETIAIALEQAQKEIANLDLDKITADALRQAAAANYFAGSPVIEKKSDTFAVNGIPKVTVEAKGCAVSVRGWDRQEVQYSVTKVAGNRNRTPLDVKTNQTASNINIKVANTGDTTRRENFFDNSSRTRIEIFVPKKSNLKITGDGEIRLEGVTGEIDLQGADSAINVRDAGGKLSVGTLDGTIRVIGFRGVFDGKTADGVMNLEGDFQSFNALAADGTIVLTLPENIDGTLESNTEIKNEGLNLVRKSENAKSWRIGKGGTIYRMSVTDGKVIVRGANALKIN